MTSSKITNFCRDFATGITKFNLQQKKWFDLISTRFCQKHSNSITSNGFDAKTFNLIPYVEKVICATDDTGEEFRGKWYSFLKWARKEGRYCVASKKHNPNYMNHLKEESSRAEFMSKNLTDNFYKLLMIIKGIDYCVQLVKDISQEEASDKKNEISMAVVKILANS